MFEKLTVLIPELEKSVIGTVIFDNEHKGTIEDPIPMPYVDYDVIVIELIKEVHTFAKNHPDYDLYNYMEIMKSYNIGFGGLDPKEVDVTKADAKLVMVLLMAVIRQDRFCDGLLLEYCKNGSVLRWIKRLKEIDETGK